MLGFKRIHTGFCSLELFLSNLCKFVVKSRDFKRNVCDLIEVPIFYILLEPLRLNTLQFARLKFLLQNLLDVAAMTFCLRLQWKLDLELFTGRLECKELFKNKRTITQLVYFYTPLGSTMLNEQTNFCIYINARFSSRLNTVASLAFDNFQNTRHHVYIEARNNSNIAA